MPVNFDTAAAKEMAHCGRVALENEQLLSAVKCFERAVEFDPYSASIVAELGNLYFQTGDYKEAAIFLIRSFKLERRKFSDWLTLTEALEITKQWSKLKSICETALEKSKENKGLLFLRLGSAQYNLDMENEASISYAKSLTTQEKVSKHGKELLELGSDRFPKRLQVLDFVESKLDTIRALANETHSSNLTDGRKVFIYWGQGFAEAPPIVKACHTKLSEELGESLISLDDSTIEDYVELPNYITNNLNISKAHKSDVIRILLLAKHGGIWIDATCYCTKNIVDYFSKHFENGFFAYNVNGPRISNWFMCSEKGSYIAKMMAAALMEHWKENKHALDYFVFHHIFESLYLTDPAFKTSWDQTFKISRSASLKLARKLGHKYEKSEFDELLKGAIVHKLTHKFEGKYKDQDFGEKSTLNYLTSKI